MHHQVDMRIPAFSAVTIIVVTIFIATFQKYRIIFLSRYFLCVRNDIFARHLRYANMIDSPPIYSNFSTIQSRFNHVIAARRPWLSSISVREGRRSCVWSNVSQVVSVARAVFMTSQLIITSVAYVYVVAFKLVYLVQFPWEIRRALISLCVGLNIYGKWHAYEKKKNIFFRI